MKCLNFNYLEHKNNSESDSESSSSEYSFESSSSSSDSETNDNKQSIKAKDKAKTEDDFDEFDDIRSMEVNRKLNHPERLHQDLCFNEPDQVRFKLEKSINFALKLRLIFNRQMKDHYVNVSLKTPHLALVIRYTLVNKLVKKTLVQGYEFKL